MTNILIADPREQSGYFLRSLFRGQKHRVMIAIDASYAKELLDTGLFDILVVDLAVDEPQIYSIVDYAELWLPMMPIIAVTNAQSSFSLNAKRFTSIIERPLQGKQINDALGRALKQFEEKWTNRRTARRIAESLPILLNLDDTPVPAQGRDISPDGIALEMPRDSKIRAEQSIPAILQLPEQPLELLGKVMFIKDDGKSKIIGINFQNLEETDQRKISDYLRKSA